MDDDTPGLEIRWRNAADPSVQTLLLKLKHDPAYAGEMVRNQYGLQFMALIAGLVLDEAKMRLRSRG